MQYELLKTSIMPNYHNRDRKRTVIQYTTCKLYKILPTSNTESLRHRHSFATKTHKNNTIQHKIHESRKIIKIVFRASVCYSSKRVLICIQCITSYCLRFYSHKNFCLTTLPPSASRNMISHNKVPSQHDHFITPPPIGSIRSVNTSDSALSILLIFLKR